MAYIAGIELGGTTCVAAIADTQNPEKILEREEFDTGIDPQPTLHKLKEFLWEHLKNYKVESFKAIAIASFGPINLRKELPTYGYILSTPKSGWQNVNVLGPFVEAFPTVPIIFETDVNAPAMAEAMVSDSLKRPNVVYITIGTGVGIGVYINGLPVHGLLHPEAGHMIVPVMSDDVYPSGCPFHKNCIEGMLSSNALASRAGVAPCELPTLPDSHWVWEIAGYYLGVLCINLTYMLSPDVIILGGGVMQRHMLLDRCRKYFKQLNAGYVLVEKFQTDEEIKEYIRPSKFGKDAGIKGALLLAKFAVK